MADRRYHHGDLRAALLRQAEATLHTTGVDGLSLRELAREVGVSHGAPRRHFEDKSALLEALVENGLLRLGGALRTAAEPAGRTFVDVLTDVATAYVDFATANPALIELMSGRRHLANASDGLIAAREESFAPIRDLVERGQVSGDLARGDVRRIGTLMFAMLHGLASMAINDMVDPRDRALIRASAEALLGGLRPARD